ncbi:hypothetical protein HGRIS_003269 [Hohenbuehelia grisea]|uniref:Uncharacterized protein n=1 Tax=Hohenbuehelia grisea TaxID=104357 RepID=A0ABR3JN64_9AGAR
MANKEKTPVHFILTYVSSTNLPKKLRIRMIPRRLSAVLSIQGYTGKDIEISSLRKEPLPIPLYVEPGITVGIKLKACLHEPEAQTTENGH